MPSLDDHVTIARSTKTSATYAVSLLVVATAALTGCGSSDDSGKNDPLQGDAAKGGTVVVGSNNFPESILLADIYGEALKSKDIKVSYKLNIGSRETTYGLIKNGTLTVLPEYNGALLAYLDAKAAPKTVEETNKAITAKLDAKLALLEPSEAQDKDAVALNEATAKKYNLTDKSTIADLADVSKDLVIGGSPEFQTRHQGLKGLKSVYGIEFKSFKALDAGGPLTAAALKGNNIQAADIFTTDPGIAKNKFVVLQDSKDLFGFQNVTPLTYKSDLPSAGVSVLNDVSAKLDTKTLIELNSQVQEGKDPLDVAKAWLSSAGLS
ncbi:MULTISPECIES: ABC transporter substrate-binding protein [Streptomyces]|uniref:Glycine/betaine ABC transporter substrate-binding protein n=1 Tax=Streptomyces dengpaensis TaxID=2049881 RepID=A0ABM6SLZ0_9ACTN|nr:MULTISPECIES: ABC transporter substrate-binding protein [Streptomyces]AVH55348.1 glycine/betaine ABC transporter substrate-binding protein [Streptomyces dengpaensis]PIB06991.1 glycine/betaine ABC transporter substrate-binding protein [Streptomyces sp. HG99]